MNGKLFCGRKKAHNSRAITTLMEEELLYLDILYGKLTELDLEIYEFEMKNDETFYFLAGELNDNNANKNKEVRRERLDLLNSRDKIEEEIDLLVNRRKALITNEIRDYRNRHNTWCLQD